MMLLVRSVSFNTPVNKVLREVVAAMQGWDHNKHTWPMRISTLPAPRTARFPRPKPKQQSVIKWAPHCSLVGSRTGHAWMWWCHASWGYPSTLCVTFLASSLRWRPLWRPVVAGGEAYPGRLQPALSFSPLCVGHQCKQSSDEPRWRVHRHM